MKFLIILCLMFCFLKADELSYCSSYHPVHNIKECFKQKTIGNHAACCGVRRTFSNIQDSFCKLTSNTKAGKNFIKTAYKFDEKKTGAKYDIQCPEKNDKIEGTCEEFSGTFVDDPK